MDDQRAKRPDRTALVGGGLLLTLAAVILWDTTNVQMTPVYGVGPTAMPHVVAAGLLLLALGHIIMAWRGELPACAPIDPRATAFILGGQLALIALIGLGAGFIAATAVLFAATAAAFGRRAVLADLAIGLVLGAVIYVVFVKLLTLSLPAGPLERFL
ncbi:MAG TPA: tripartite tricarboxylate transporter TctB family protein [Xanthobacteraceae bacterium]|nr:tripartite tricarboxylate transporter TctB family protein [Xanthobacteraceae bacterium]